MITRTTAKAALTAAALTMLASPMAGAAAPKVDNSAALAALDAQLPGTLIDDPTSLDWATQGDGMKITGVTGDDIPGGGAATHFDIRKPGPNPWSQQVYVPLTADIAKGDAVAVGFWARAVALPEGGKGGTLSLRIQENADPYPGFGDSRVEIGPEWKWHEVSATATADISKRAGVLVFQLGAAKQVLEIGQTIVVKGADKISGDGARPAAPLPPQLAGKGELISQPDNREWTFFGPETAHVQREDKTIYLGSAIQVTVAEKGVHPYDIHANVPLTEEIKAGDKLLIAVAAKTVSATTDDGKALIGMRVQWNQPPYDGFSDHSFPVGPNWQLIQIQTTAQSDIPAGKGLVVLHLAGAAQVIDLGPTYVLKLPPAP
jgi:hypothetical protein